MTEPGDSPRSLSAGSGFKGGFFGCLGASAAVLVLGFGILALSYCHASDRSGAPSDMMARNATEAGDFTPSNHPPK